MGIQWTTLPYLGISIGHPLNGPGICIDHQSDSCLDRLRAPTNEIRVVQCAAVGARADTRHFEKMERSDVELIGKSLDMVGCLFWYR